MKGARARVEASGGAEKWSEPMTCSGGRRADQAIPHSPAQSCRVASGPEPGNGPKEALLTPGSVGAGGNFVIGLQPHRPGYELQIRH